MSTESSESQDMHVKCEDNGLAGFYGSAPVTNVHVANSSASVLLAAVDKIKINSGKLDVFCFCDYGTGDGTASMPLIYACIKKIKETFGEEQNVHIIYEDQPANEFKQIFIKLNEPESFQEVFSNVYVSSVGRSYYEQCLPSNTLHLGYSVMCMHWLSSKPCNITNGLIPYQITVESERRSFKKHAAKDWELILLRRAAEMKNGGRFLSVQSCTGDNGSFNGNTVREKGDVYLNMKECLQHMVQIGRITQEEYHNTCMLIYYRTFEEYAAPFQDESSPVRQAGLKLISITPKWVACRYLEEWLLNPSDPMVYARKFIDGGVRPWANYSIYSGLSETRSPEERREIVDEYFENVINEVSKTPSAYAMNYIHAHVLFEKKLN